MDPITQARLNARFQELMAELLSTRVRDPRVAGVTITGVQVTNDLSVAKVHYSLLGDVETRRLAQRGLESVSGFLRGEIGRHLRLRTVPELRFAFDASLEHGQRIETLLREWHEGKAGGEDDEGGAPDA